MTNDRLREYLTSVLEEMKTKAEEMHIQGVAAGAVLNRNESVDWVGGMKVVETPFNFKEGWNLIAIAWSKYGEAMATQATAAIPHIRRYSANAGS